MDSPGLDESLWWGLPRLQGLEQQLWLLPSRGQEPRLQLGQSKMRLDMAPCPLLGTLSYRVIIRLCPTCRAHGGGSCS